MIRKKSLLLKCFEWISIFTMLSMLISSSSNAEVLELGESQLTGKKDQPEAMTFVSRAPLDLRGKATLFDSSKAIKKEINNKVFDLVLPE